MITRRMALTALAGLAAIRGARAQVFPSRPITIIVPYPAGGPVDITDG
jgi:tripartite-type tricarboxylate transporter receptor subunit TctC